MAALVALVAGLVPVAPAAAAPPDDAERLLAVVNATGGTLREAGDGHRLVLDGVAPRAVWFSDRPARGVGSLTMDELVESFFGSSASPNAALEVFDGPGAGEIVVVELSNPRVRRGGDRLVVDARILRAGDGTEGASREVPPRFGAAALYLDDAVCSTDGGDAGCLFGNGGDGGAGGDAGTGGRGGDGTPSTAAPTTTSTGGDGTGASGSGGAGGAGGKGGAVGIDGAGP